MTTATLPSGSPGRLLRRKEWKESRPASFIGLIIFIALPTLWTVMMWGLDPRDGIFPGFATGG